MATFEMQHTVGFEETNLVGNVYYVNHLRWQGRCRELFLREAAPEILDQLHHGLALATVRCSCEYFAELSAFDQIVLRMSLAGIAQNRVTMRFDYVRIARGDRKEAPAEELVARGEQEIACLRREGERTVPTPIPEALRRGLERFGAAPVPTRALHGT